MKMEKMPEVTRTSEGAFWKNSYENFDVEVYVPHSPLQGDILNYGFIAPYLLIFNDSHHNMWEVTSHCGPDLHFPDD